MVNEDELDNIYIGLGDEDVLFEEDDELGDFVKYEDVKECGKYVEGVFLVKFNKISFKEENVCEESLFVDQFDFFYEFSKFIFIKGKFFMVVCSLCK